MRNPPRPLGDEDALESLPLKLLVVSVVATMSIVPAADALESLENREFVSRCTAQLQGIVRICQILSVEGPGAVRTMSLDLRSQGSVGMSCLSIGAAYGLPGMCSVALELSNGARIIATAEQPSVWICSQDMGTLVLHSCVQELRLGCAAAPGGVCVEAEAV